MNKPYRPLWPWTRRAYRKGLERAAKIAYDQCFSHLHRGLSMEMNSAEINRRCLAEAKAVGRKP